LSIFALFVAVPAAEAGSFEAFWRSVKHVFAGPKHKTVAHRTVHKRTNEPKPREPSSTPTPDVISHAPPSERNIQPATRATGKKDSRRDLRYGIPVPGKTGLVTSPFAPDSGYIDIRAFPPGTPVKDPYSGKVFLTP
jgi:hypothetical protein